MIKPIKNAKQHGAALERAYRLMQQDVKPGSEQADELEVLSILIKDYEEKTYPMDKPNPVDAIKFRLEQLNISEAQLFQMLGYRTQKPEILSGKKKLNLSMIRKLNERLQIPAEVLIQPY